MNFIKTRANQLLLIVLLILPWTTIEALEDFREAGVIAKIDYDSFYVDNQKYQIAPNARIEILERSNARLSDLKTGDTIYFTGQTLSGVNYVDFIVYHLQGDD